MREKIDISVVVPVYQAEGTLEVLIKRLVETLNALELSFEIILVEDGSRDRSWGIIKEKAQRSVLVKGIKLSRNFGQHNAISAGLKYAGGERVVVMDGDLQDLPEEIEKLYRKAIEGFDIVVGQRMKRSDSKKKIWSSKIFYKIFENFTGIKFEPGIANFGIYHKKVIQAVLMYQESFRPFPIIVKNVGFKRAAIEIIHGNRMAGNSNYNGFSLMKGALNTVLYYSHKPIWFFLIGGVGVVVFLLFLLLGVLFLTLNISTLQLIVALIVLLSFVSLNIAVMGIYVSRIFIEIKNRPSYIIDELILSDDI